MNRLACVITIKCKYQITRTSFLSIQHRGFVNKRVSLAEPAPINTVPSLAAHPFETGDFDLSLFSANLVTR